MAPEKRISCRCLQTFLACIKDESYPAADLETRLNPTITCVAFINALCRVGILEYGTSPRYGTLTYKGQQLREYMLSKAPEALYAIATQEFDPTDPLCSPGFCNCPGAVGRIKGATIIRCLIPS